MRTMEQNLDPLGLSVIVTVYSETFSVTETVTRLLQNDRGAIREILLVVSPRSSPECLTICHDLARSNEIVRVHIQQNGPGVGWALREGMSLAKEECVAIMS